MWTPDVYEGAPTPVTAFFSVAPKMAAMALFVRVMVGPFHGALDRMAPGDIWSISVASMVLGAFAAIDQTQHQAADGLQLDRPCRLRADRPRRRQAGRRAGVLVYLAIYLFMNVGIFAVILCDAAQRQGDRRRSTTSPACRATRPALALALGIFMFSLAGLPPFAGFFAKFYVFLAAIEPGSDGAGRHRRARQRRRRLSTTCASSS